MVRRSILDGLYRELQEIRYRLDDIEKSFSLWKPQPLEVSESKLFSLPDHLRKTYLTVLSIGECNAAKVSNLTGRCRSIESSYLNQLTRTGWIARRRRSKEVCFYPIASKVLSNSGKKEGLELKSPVPESISNRNHRREASSVVRNIQCLSTDYDGTISSLGVSRDKSRVPVETRVMLHQISRSLPVLVLTMKDLHFIRSKTPFAQAWSGIGGLETHVGKRVIKKSIVNSKLPAVAEAYAFAKSHMTIDGLEIEEKQDSEGHLIAFCVDWRQTMNPVAAKEQASLIADYAESLGLEVLKYERNPFFDVYPVVPDKGKALREMLDELSIKSGVMYLGDSETDNSAFRNSSVSIGIVHDENLPDNLECDYYVKFDDVPAFLRTLIANKFRFSPDYPMVKVACNSPKRV